MLAYKKIPYSFFVEKIWDFKYVGLNNTLKKSVFDSIVV